jgi:hypothetical protein
MDKDGDVLFQYRSVDLPEWTDVDEVRIQFRLSA